MAQYTLDGKLADPTLMTKSEGSATRTYRFKERASVANLVDQMALLSDRTKSDVVADSIRLAALFTKLAGPKSLETIAQCDDLADLLRLCGLDI